MTRGHRPGKGRGSYDVYGGGSAVGGAPGKRSRVQERYGSIAPRSPSPYTENLGGMVAEQPFRDSEPTEPPDLSGLFMWAEGPAPSGPVQRKATDGSEDALAPGAETALAQAGGGSGASLPSGLRLPLEQSLGTELAGVKLHTGAGSAKAANAIGARAYTTGKDIHFGDGQFDPASTGGKKLIAHEVAHTVQQDGATARRQAKLEVSSPSDSSEREADTFADIFTRELSGPSAPSGRRLNSTKSEWSRTPRATVRFRVTHGYGA